MVWSTTTPNIPENIQEALNKVLGQAQNPDLFQIADFTEDELAAFDLIKGNVGQAAPLIGQGASYAANLLGPQGAINTGDISYFMNPYTQAVIDPAIRELQSASERQRSQVQDTALASGAFGGSRLGLLEQGIMRDTQINIGDLTQKGLFDAYNAASQTALNSKTLGLQGATSLSSMAKLLQEAGLTDAASLQNIGETQRIVDQSRLDLPYSQNQYLSNVLGSLAPMQIGSVSRGPNGASGGGSSFNSIAGGAAALAGLWNPSLFSGGGGGSGLSGILGSAVNGIGSLFGGGSTGSIATSGGGYNYGPVTTFPTGYADGGPVKRSPQLWEFLIGRETPTEADLMKSRIAEKGMRGNLGNFYDLISRAGGATPFSELRDSSEDPASIRSIRNFLRETAGMPSQKVPPPLETAVVPERPEPVDVPLAVAEDLPKEQEKVVQKIAEQTAPQTEESSFFDMFKGESGVNEPLLALGLALMASDKKFGQALGEAGLVGLKTNQEAQKARASMAKAAAELSLQERAVAAQETTANASMMRGVAAQLKALGGGQLADSTINTIISEASKAGETAAAQGLFEIGSPEHQEFVTQQALKFAQDAGGLKSGNLSTLVNPAASSDPAGIRSLLDK